LEECPSYRIQLSGVETLMDDDACTE